VNLSEARRLASIVHRDPCGGLPRAELRRRVGLGPDAFKVAAMIAYRCGWVGFIRDYIVATRPEWAAGSPVPGDGRVCPPAAGGAFVGVDPGGVG